MKLFLPFSLLVIFLCLTGCKNINKTQMAIINRDKHYLEAKTIPPLRIPPGLNSDQFHSYYPVSDSGFQNKSKYIDVTPPGL